MYGYNNPTIRTTEDGEQVGPKMHSAVRAVGQKVWQSKKQLAEHVGPNGSTDYGYRIVDRCLSKRLVQIHPKHSEANPHGKGAVILTDKGARYLNETVDAGLDPSEYVDSDAFWSRANEEWR